MEYEKWDALTTWLKLKEVKLSFRKSLCRQGPSLHQIDLVLFLLVINLIHEGNLSYLEMMWKPLHIICVEKTAFSFLWAQAYYPQGLIRLT